MVSYSSCDSLPAETHLTVALKVLSQADSSGSDRGLMLLQKQFHFSLFGFNVSFPPIGFPASDQTII